MTYAEQSYAMKLVAIQERLADFTRAVNRLDAKAPVVDWGHVGDLGHVLDQLSQIEIPDHGHEVTRVWRCSP